MNQNEVNGKLIAILEEYQDVDTGRINDNICPLQDIKGFESDFIPEVVRQLAREVFGEPLPKGTRVKNIFVEKGRKLKVDEISRKFLDTYAPKGVTA